MNSCVLAVRGTTHECTITSNVPGAEFQFGEHRGTTPATVTLRRARYSISFNCVAPGYETHHQVITPEATILTEEPLAAIAAVLSIFSLVGALTDYFNAADIDYPHEIHVEFARPSEGLTKVTLQRPGPRERHL